MVQEALNDFALQPQDLLVVGDSKRDYGAARAAHVDFAWVRDDLGRVSEEDMAASGCPIFNDVAALVQHYYSRPGVHSFAPHNKR
jgi:phosphoglycolate phosphatase-like HAD superfamily hydrolase